LQDTTLLTNTTQQTDQTRRTDHFIFSVSGSNLVAGSSRGGPCTTSMVEVGVD
jgi:hypothetical protein